MDSLSELEDVKYDLSNFWDPDVELTLDLRFLGDDDDDVVDLLRIVVGRVVVLAPIELLVGCDGGDAIMLLVSVVVVVVVDLAPKYMDSFFCLLENSSKLAARIADGSESEAFEMTHESSRKSA